MSAVLTGILRGCDIYVLTSDTDMEEQCYKLLSVMNSHYQAMLVGEWYASHPEAMAFTPMRLSGKQSGGYEGDVVLVYPMPRKEFVRMLPQNPRPVYITCLLIGGDGHNLKLTRTTFCAEMEMASLLRMKMATGGLNTNKFGKQNIYVELTTFNHTEPGYLIYIGKENRMMLASQEFNVQDAGNILTCNERTSRYHPTTCPGGSDDLARSG